MEVGRLRLIDPEAFDLINFNRQRRATIDTIGEPKASTAAQQLEMTNPDAAIERRSASNADGPPTRCAANLVCRQWIAALCLPGSPTTLGSHRPVVLPDPLFTKAQAVGPAGPAAAAAMDR